MRRVVRQGSQSRIVGIFPEEHVGIIPKVHAQCRNDGIFRRRIGYQRALVHAGEQSKDRVCVKSAAVCGLLPVYFESSTHRSSISFNNSGWIVLTTV